MNGTFSNPPGTGSPSGAAGDPSSADPVSWLQIEHGWAVVTTDSDVVGTVVQIEGDKNDDIFDGLAVQSGKQVLYVPGEQVGQIFPGRVTLKIGSSEIAALEPFTAPPPETKWTAGKLPFSKRLSNFFRGKG